MNTYQRIVAPNNQDLEVVLNIGNEGIMSKGVRVFEGTITGWQLANYFSIESSSEFYPEELKRQRDLEKSRSKKLVEYFDTRCDTVLPSITIFISELVNEEIFTIRGKELLAATIPADADRLIADGQNRWNLYNSQDDEGVLEQTIGVKFICADSDSLKDKTSVIRQLFSDYHSNLIKPKTALNLYYNSNDPYCQLLRKFLDVGVEGAQLKDFVSTTGKLKGKQFLLYNQLSDLICLFAKTTPARLNKELKEKPDVESSYAASIGNVLETFFNYLPMVSAEDTNMAPNYMFTKAIFLKACMYVARSILEESIEDGVQPDWSRMSRISELPLLDMSDKFWISAGAVKQKEKESKAKNEFTMVSKSEQSLARKLCRVLKIQPCEAI